MIFTCFIINLTLILNGIAQSKSPEYFELRILDNKSAYICKDEPIKLSIKSSDDTLKYVLLKDGMFFKEVSDDFVIIYRGGVYAAEVELRGRTYRTNDLYIGECMPFQSTKNSVQSPNSPNHIVANISSTDNIICGNKTESHLSASPTGSNFTYKWYYSLSLSGNYSEVLNNSKDLLTVDKLGFYKVMVMDGIDAPGVSSPFEVKNNTYAYISDITNNSYATKIVNVGDSLELKVRADNWTGPINFEITQSFSSGISYRFQRNENPTVVKVKVNQNTQYSITNVSTSCGNIQYTSGYVKAITDQNIGVNFNAQTTMNVCAGGLIQIPYVEIGTWGNKKTFAYSIWTSSGQYVDSGREYYMNPLEFKVPKNLELGKDYRLNLYCDYPILKDGYAYSQIKLVVTGIGCLSKPVIRISPINEHCQSVNLSSVVSGGDNTFQWYKNDQVISGAIGSSYVATSSGNYKVTIIDNSTNYNQTSSNYPITILGTSPLIQSSSTVLCGNKDGVNLYLSSSNQGIGSYQWTYSVKSYGSFKDIPNATNSSYLAKLSGYYQLRTSVPFGCDNTSNPIFISESGAINVTDLSTGNNYSEILQGQNATLKINFSGLPPYMLQYDYEGKTKTIYTTSSQEIISFSPKQNTYYYFSNLTNGCGIGDNSQSFLVRVNDQPQFTLKTPSTTTTCLNGRIVIPIDLIGSWAEYKRFYVYLVDGNGNNVSNSGKTIITQNSELIYDVSRTIAPGTYFFRIYGNTPSTLTVQSSFSITISNTSCQSLPEARISLDALPNSCTSGALLAYPELSNATYEWYFDDVLYTSSSGNSLSWLSNGLTTNVKVRIRQNDLQYISMSPSVYHTFAYANFINKVSSSSSLCSPPTILSTIYLKNASFEWFKSDNNFGFQKIVGANSSIFTADTKAVYRSITSVADCQFIEETRCDLGIYYEPITICPGGGIDIRFDSPKYYNAAGLSGMLFQLINSATNKVEIDTLRLILDPNSSSVNRQLLLQTPITVSEGSYKIKLIASSTNSVIGNSVVTIKKGGVTAKPLITISPSSVSGNSNTIVWVKTSCDNTAGYIDWKYASEVPIKEDGRNLNFGVYGIAGAQFTMGCFSYDGCPSYDKVYTNFDCNDSYEPNNQINQSKLMDSTNYSSGLMCFTKIDDSDWFSFTFNGRQYFIEASANSNGVVGYYYLKKVISGNSFVISTEQKSPIIWVDTFLKLYDQNGILLSWNNDGNGNGLSKITYIPSNPCQSNLSLKSPTFDVFSGTNSLIKSKDFIKVEIIQFDNTKTTLESGQTIELKPGFETKIKNGGFFKSEIKNCVN